MQEAVQRMAKAIMEKDKALTEYRDAKAALNEANFQMTLAERAFIEEMEKMHAE